MELQTVCVGVWIEMFTLMQRFFFCAHARWDILDQAALEYSDVMTGVLQISANISRLNKNIIGSR